MSAAEERARSRATTAAALGRAETAARVLSYRRHLARRAEIARQRRLQAARTRVYGRPRPAGLFGSWLAVVRAALLVVLVSWCLSCGVCGLALLVLWHAGLIGLVGAVPR